MKSLELYQVVNSEAVGDSVPAQFKIFPLGVVKSTKGDFLVDNESYSLMRKSFKDRQLQIPIDYEHQTLKEAQAPAAGWITDLFLKDDGVYGQVNWTEKAREYLKNREYKYTSPVLMVRGSDRKAVQLHSVALTNKPAIDALIPLVNSENDMGRIEDDQTEQVTPIVALQKLLDLPEGASVEDIRNAVDALLEQNSELQLKVSALQFEAYKEKVDSNITLALTEGKLMPYQRDWAYNSAMADLDSFTLWCNDTLPIIPMGEMSYPCSVGKGDVSRSDELLGLSRDTVKRYGTGKN